MPDRVCTDVTALAGLPAIPGTSCPSAAAALGTTGLGPVCQLASGVTGVVGSAASQVAGFGVNSVLNAMGTWVADGAVGLGQRVLAADEAEMPLLELRSVKFERSTA